MYHSRFPGLGFIKCVKLDEFILNLQVHICIIIGDFLYTLSGYHADTPITIKAEAKP